MEFLDVAFARRCRRASFRSLNECLPKAWPSLLRAYPLEPASLSSAIQIATYEVTFPDMLIERHLDGIAFED